MENVKVVTFGEGKIISNWGTYEGHPAVYLEPVLGEPGIVGEVTPSLENNDLDKVRDGGVILQFKSSHGMRILLEDIGMAGKAFIQDEEAQ
jgi:hypothetical protein